MKTTKQHLIESAASASGKTHEEARAVVEAFFRTVCWAVKKGRRAEMRGWGTFFHSDRAGRPVCWNPRTMEMVAPIPPWRKLRWRPSPELVQAIRGAKCG